VNEKDIVYTPDGIARKIVDFFQPSGRILEPSKGEGVFLKYLPPNTEWCEIREGRDFFAWKEKVDWIIGNPPYSVFSDWLRHSFEVAENIVYLIPVNKPFNSNRLMRDIYEYGGIRQIYVIGHGRWLGWQMGYAVGAVYFQRGWKGGISIKFASDERKGET
jgi:hypothetical protein